MKKLIIISLAALLAMPIFGQTNQTNDLKLNRDKKLLSINNSLNVKKAELRALVLDENTDMKVIDAKIDEITKLQNEKMKINAAYKHSTWKSLPEDQRYCDHSTRYMLGKGGERNGRGDAMRSGVERKHKRENGDNVMHRNR